MLGFCTVFVKLKPEDDYSGGKGLLEIDYAVVYIFKGLNVQEGFLFHKYCLSPFV